MVKATNDTIQSLNGVHGLLVTKFMLTCFSRGEARLIFFFGAECFLVFVEEYVCPVFPYLPSSK